MLQHRYHQIKVAALLRPRCDMHPRTLVYPRRNLDLQRAPVAGAEGADGAAECFLQRYLYRIFRRRPAGGFAAGAEQVVKPEPAAAAKILKPSPAAAGEKVAKVGAVYRRLPAETAAGPPVGARLFVIVGVAPVFSVAVILLAGIRIGQYAVGFVDFLELFLRRGVALVDVRVVLPGQPPVGLADFFFRGISGDAQHIVVIAHISPSRPAAFPAGIGLP